MQRLVLTLVLTFLLFSNVHAGRTVFKNGNTYEGQVNWTSRIKYDLPPGKWKLIDKYAWYWSSISGRGITLMQEENGKVTQFYEIGEFDTNGKYIAYLNSFLQEIMFKGKHDGCYERPEYNILIRRKKGASFNCFKVRHYDLDKRIHAPDTHWQEMSLAGIKNYFKKNPNLKLPRIMLASVHDFYNLTVTGKALYLTHLIEPEHFGGPKSEFTTEDSSEYHRTRIESHPKHKKYMKDFVSSAAYRHAKFEDGINAKKKHKLDLSQIKMQEFKNTNKTLSGNDTDIKSQILALTELYKSGTLSKAEFDKAMKKILN